MAHCCEKVPGARISGKFLKFCAATTWHRPPLRPMQMALVRPQWALTQKGKPFQLPRWQPQKFSHFAEATSKEYHPSPSWTRRERSVSLSGPQRSEVSKRGWRTEGVVTKKSFLCQRLRPLFCTLFFFPPPLRRRVTHFWRMFWLLFGVCLSPTPSRQPLLRNL